VSTELKPYLTPEEYLASERCADHKSEYFGGEVFAMAGASEAHNTLCVNISSEFRIQFRGRPCRTYANDMRVKVSTNGLYTYPDVIAVCGERIFDDTEQDTLLNPTVIVEVLSPTTELYDRSKKFALYSGLDSLTDYLLVAQDRPHVELYTRHGESQWLLTVAESLEADIPIQSIGCTLALSAIYENVDFGLAETLAV
jgi:Uma2 family endonuclease